jgi:TPP-dependent pyruvate/acetoin dehydrogenase alpha subunit
MRAIDYFDKSAELHPDRTAIMEGDTRYSYRETRAFGKRIARGMLASGSTREQRAAIFSQNHPAVLFCMLGILRAGAAWVPINFRNAADANVEFLNYSETAWLFYHSHFREQIEEIRKRVPTLQHLVCIDGADSGHPSLADLADPERYFPGTSGMVGQSIAHAAGAALTAQVKNTGQIVYCFFGDGASKQGAFFETLNLAAIWKLPVVFILENNEYQAYTQVGLEDANAQAGDPLSRKAATFSIPGVTVDGTDPLLVYAEVAKAAERARAGHGPSLIESKFYRLSAHGNAITVPPVPTQFPEHEAIGVYGNKAEYRAAKENDPVPRFRAHLHGESMLTEAELQKIDDSANTEMDAAVEFALASPLPAPEEATKYVFA